MDFIHQLTGSSSTSDQKAHCPECKQALQPATAGEIPLERCPQCNGAWVSFESFDLLPVLPAEQVAPFQDPADTAHTLQASVSPRGCPNCAAPMINFLFRTKIWLDWCPDGHGMWLDRGELALVHQIRTESEALSDEQKRKLLEQVAGLSRR